MPRTRLATIVFVVAALVAGSAGAALAPLGADGGSSTDARAERDRLRAERARSAAALDGLNASEAELRAAVAALDEHVAAQTRRVEAARQAVAAAEAERDQARAAAEATRIRIVDLTEVVVDRAVEAYMVGGTRGTAYLEVWQGEDAGSVARGHVMLDEITGRDVTAIDELRAARLDLQAQEREAAAAASRADAHRAEAEGRLGELRDARAEQEAQRAVLEQRRRAVLAEIDALAAQDAQLTQLIRTREAEEQRRREAEERRRRQAEAAERARRQQASQGGTAPPADRTGGQVDRTARLMWPTRGVVTSEYGQRWGRLHAGIDIAAPTGSTIVAADSGRVIYSGWMNGYGNVVVVDHGGSLTTVYAHQSRIVARDGASVARGELIGYVGSTGYSTGPHLHFETRVNGSPRNPRQYLP